MRRLRLKDPLGFTLLGMALLSLLVVAAVAAPTMWAANYLQARTCHIAQQQYRRHTHYVTLSACYIDAGDGRRVRLDSYTPIVRAR